MKRPTITMRWDAESESFVAGIPALDILSAGTTEKEAAAAVFDAAMLAFEYWRDVEQGSLARPELTTC